MHIKGYPVKVYYGVHKIQMGVPITQKVAVCAHVVRSSYFTRAASARRKKGTMTINDNMSAVAIPLNMRLCHDLDGRCASRISSKFRPCA